MPFLASPFFDIEEAKPDEFPKRPCELLPVHPPQFRFLVSMGDSIIENGPTVCPPFELILFQLHLLIKPKEEPNRVGTSQTPKSEGVQNIVLDLYSKLTGMRPPDIAFKCISHLL